MRLLLNTILLLTVFAVPALADGYVYKPEGCEFQLEFPGEPYETRRCHDQLSDKCTLMTSYTQVFELNATLNFYVNCKPSDKDFRKDFTPDLMRTSLLARPNVHQLEVYDINYKETDDALMGAIFGAGKSPHDNDQMVYVAQIWVGNSSVLTFEGEMIGEQNEDADKMFAKVMSSLRPVNWHPEAEKDKKDGGDKDAAPKADSKGDDSAPKAEK